MTEAIVPGKDISVLRLKISLDHIDPTPWREFEIRADRTLAHLHDAIQAAFLWYDLHLWQFEIGTRRYELKGQNQGLEPMFGPPVMDAATKKLGFFLKPVVPPVVYTYDFGDDWRHRVVPVAIRQMAPDEPLPRFLGGSWATPPEDIGGPPGYELFREARGNPNHPEHDWAKEAGYLDWVHTEIHQDAIVSAFAELQKQKRRAPNPWMSES